MATFIHNHPGAASLWLSLCLLILNLIYSAEKEFNGYGAAAAHHARSAISLGRGTVDISKVEI